MPNDKASDILEAARIDCQYQTLPLKDIKRRVAARGSYGLTGMYYDCWAVHNETGKHKECAILAKSPDGATFNMNKYLTVMCKVEPTEYTLFIGREMNMAFHNYRMRILGVI